MKKVMLSLILLSACSAATSPASPTTTTGGRKATTTPGSTVPDTSVVTRRTESDVTPSAAPESTEAPIVPPRPAQREVPAPVTSILEVTYTPTIQSDLLACLKRYESGNGSGSANLYQFDQSTWESAGGTGTPDNASASEQDAVAQNWIDEGHLRQAWAAQRGRCF